MIPGKSTPIKNEILIDIFAKGKLSQLELRIIFYIIRWSWGFDGVKRRQDWTKELAKRKIADHINIDRGKCCYILNKMIEENKIIENNKCYQFNEHYKDWKKLTKSQSLQNIKVDEKSIINRQKVNQKLIKGQPKVDEKSISADLKSLQDKPLLDRKETLKDTYKETLKGNNLFNNKLIRGKKKLSDLEIKKNKENITKSKKMFLDIAKQKKKEGK